MKVHGSCHCGDIRYEAEVDPAQVGICNCSDCQMLTGSAFRVSVPASSAGFRLLSGTPKVYVKTADSGTRRRIWCKSALPWSQDVSQVPGIEGQ